MAAPIIEPAVRVNIKIFRICEFFVYFFLPRILIKKIGPTNQINCLQSISAQFISREKHLSKGIHILYRAPPILELSPRLFRWPSRPHHHGSSMPTDQPDQVYPSQNMSRRPWTVMTQPSKPLVRQEVLETRQPNLHNPAVVPQSLFE